MMSSAQERVEPEGGQHRDEVLHDLGLDRFVTRPVGGGSETVDLKRQTVLGRGEGPHHREHAVVYGGVVREVEIHVCPQQTRIGVDRAVGQPVGIGGVGGAALGGLPLLGRDVAGKKRIEGLHAFQKVGRAWAYAVELEHVLAHDAPPARLLHGAPVDERPRYQRVGRYGYGRVVEIKHLDYVERDVRDRAVDVVLRHLDPVAQAQHVVPGDHHARHEPEYRILEYQHQHRRKGPESGDEARRRLAYDDRSDDYQRDAGEYDLEYLYEALERAVLPLLAFAEGVARGAEYGVYGEEQRQEETYPCQTVADDEPVRSAVEGEREQRHYRERRHDRCQLAEDAVAEHRPDNPDLFAPEYAPRDLRQNEMDDHGRDDP